MFNQIIQQTHYLLGTQQDLEALEKKVQARLLVISDSHNHYSIFKKIVLSYGKNCDALIFCGDGIGDLIQLVIECGKNDELKKEIETLEKENEELMKKLGNVEEE